MGSGSTPRSTLTARACFNPRSHMGSDDAELGSRALWHVSIHAPTWGATLFTIFLKLLSYVSIHAPTWGATFILFSADFQKKFQSTLPHGERQDLADVIGSTSQFQSTLPHGERRELGPGQIAVMKFQSTLPHGERHARVDMISCWILFQSTLPHGERLRGTWCPRMNQCCFNPRSHMGSDSIIKGYRRRYRVSIHAPTWGATCRPCFLVSSAGVSIHAPTWGATPWSLHGFPVPCGFNPRSHMGSDDYE